MVKRILQKCIVPLCVIFIVLLLFMVSWRLFLSEPRIIQVAPSPDGQYMAYVYESNGGATTRFTYHLSVVRCNQTLRKGNGNLYISGSEFSIKWMSDNCLYVNNFPTINIYKQKTEVMGIEVQYAYVLDRNLERPSNSPYLVDQNGN